MLEQTMQDGVKPDDCILLDLDVETAIRRTGKRTTEASRFDTETRDFFRRARQRFLDVARAGRLGQKNIIVNGHKGPETILHEIVESLGIGGRPAAVRRLPPPSWPKQRQGHERADPGIAEVMKWEYHAGDYLFMQAVPRRPNQADDIISVLADVASRHDLTTVAELPDKMRERFTEQTRGRADNRSHWLQVREPHPCARACDGHAPDTERPDHRPDQDDGSSLP